MSLNSAVTDVQWSPNFSGGRPAGAPNVIVVHHWGVDGQSHQGVVNYLCNPGNHGASAHYVVSSGRVTQLVSDWDRAWHAGPSGNPRGIGIECRPEMSSGDVATLQKLISAIRAQHGDLPVKGHRDFMSTACPGRYYGILSALNAGTAAGGTGSDSSVSDDVATVPTTEAGKTGYGYITVDGKYGIETWARLRRVMGAWYPAPWSDCVKNLQRFLNEAVPPAHQRNLHGGDSLVVDGVEGTRTWITLQFFLWNRVPNRPNKVWDRFCPGWRFQDFVDGVFGEATVAVLQEALNWSVAESKQLCTWKES